jgi:hypothetical protein
MALAMAAGTAAEILASKSPPNAMGISQSGEVSSMRGLLDGFALWWDLPFGLTMLLIDSLKTLEKWSKGGYNGKTFLKGQMGT